MLVVPAGKPDGGAAVDDIRRKRASGILPICPASAIWARSGAGRIYRGIRGWTRACRRWLTTVRFDHPAQQLVLQDYIRAIEDAEARLARLEWGFWEHIKTREEKDRLTESDFKTPAAGVTP